MSNFKWPIKLLIVLHVFGATSAYELERSFAREMTSLTNSSDQPQELTFEHKSGECGSHFAFPTKIAGGYDARWGEYPSFVSVSSEYPTHNCGGTILKPNIILTAAHCVYDGMAVQPTLKRPGPEDINRWIRASKICVSRIGNDVAILRLEKDIVFSEFVQPACLPYLKLTREKQAYAMGLGYLSDPEKCKSSTLQVIPVKRAADSECDLVQQQYMCFGSNNPYYVGDVCQGDSGSPVIALIDGKQTVFGVVSGGPECRPGLRTISRYFDVYRELEDVKSLIYDCEQ